VKKQTPETNNNNQGIGIDAQTEMMACHIKLLKSTLLHNHQFK
jgi:hypothetical protein